MGLVGRGRAWQVGPILSGMPVIVALDGLCDSCAKVGKTHVPRSLPGDVVICCLCGSIEARDADNQSCGLTLDQWNDLEAVA